MGMTAYLAFPISLVRKSTKNGESCENRTEYMASKSPKVCPYKGFRKHVVGLIGNCLYSRDDVQDEIRQKNGVLLLLQQCVTDEDNPFLREWGIWMSRNLFAGNVENQREVAELKVQGYVDSPEIAELGLRLEVDSNTGRPKLVNISADEKYSFELDKNLEQIDAELMLLNRVNPSGNLNQVDSREFIHKRG